jgi:hypothetical protein
MNQPLTRSRLDVRLVAGSRVSTRIKCFKNQVLLPSRTKVVETVIIIRDSTFAEMWHRLLLIEGGSC